MLVSVNGGCPGPLNCELTTSSRSPATAAVVGVWKSLSPVLARGAPEFNRRPNG